MGTVLEVIRNKWDTKNINIKLCDLKLNFMV